MEMVEKNVGDLKNILYQDLGWTKSIKVKKLLHMVGGCFFAFFYDK